MTEFEELDKRSREIFQKIVENYLISGEPTGSRSISQGLSEKISPATIRNVMANLEALNLLDAPHVSAGRLPTERGLRLFVDGILEMKLLSEDDRQMMQSAMRQTDNQNGADLYARTGSLLSEISKSASLVFTKPSGSAPKQIDFVWLSKDQALVILVGEDGQVDNRLFTPPMGMSASDMQRAANFINAQLAGQSLGELHKQLQSAITKQRQEIDEKMAHLIEIGSAFMVEEKGNSQLIVRGRAHLIDDQKSQDEIEMLRELMNDLESKKDLVELLELSDKAEAVRVFIGSENKLFSLKSSSLVVSPYMNGDGKIVGAVGVIGPTRLNYARIVPLVSYTANLIGNYVKNEDEK